MSGIEFNNLAIGGGWSKESSCHCVGGDFIKFYGVDKAPFVYPATTGAVLPGLSHHDTAILAGVLTGLATFLFLALPILCCLCPIPCCGGAGGAAGKKKAAAAGGMHKEMDSFESTDVESMKSFKSWDKMDYDRDNLYAVDMRLPRAWMQTLRGVPEDQMDAKFREFEEGGWEGMDMTRNELYGGGGGDGGMVDAGQIYTNTAAASAGGGGGGGGEAGAQTDTTEVTREYESTRTFTMGGGQSGGGNASYSARGGGGGGGGGGSYQGDYVYGRDFDEQQGSNDDKDNFMKIYWAYRKYLDDSNRRTSVA